MPGLLVNLVVLLTLILANGLLSMAEIALIASRRARLTQMAEAGSRGAARALALSADPTRFLSTVQVGITMISVLTGVVGGATLSEPVADRLATIPWLADYAHPLAIGGTVVGIAYFTLVFGELAPKRMAMANPERLAVTFSALLLLLQRLTGPASWLLRHSTDLVLRLVPVARGAMPSVTDDEIRILMREGAEAGHFHAGETAIVDMALRLGDRRVSAIMVPRTRMAVLDIADPPEELLHQLLTTSFSRLPVVDSDPANVIGILQIRDLVVDRLTGPEPGPLPDLRRFLREPLYIPDTAPALKALELFKASGRPIGLIVDEYGAIEGLVTPNDILTALVGDIATPGLPDEPNAIRRADGSWLISGLMPLDEACDLIGAARRDLIEDDDDEFHTVGGLLMARLKRIPGIGDSIAIRDTRFEVVAMDGLRVDRVSVVTGDAAGR